MKNKYEDEYGCIAQIIYQDSVNVYKEEKLSRHKLPLPSPNSLEAVLADTKFDYLFFSTDELDRVAKLRILGMHLIPSDEMEMTINLKCRIDGVLYMK